MPRTETDYMIPEHAAGVQLVLRALGEIGKVVALKGTGDDPQWTQVYNLAIGALKSADACGLRIQPTPDEGGEG